MHQMVLMLGDIALSRNSTKPCTALHQLNIHALPAKNITAEDQSNSVSEFPFRTK